MEKSLTDAVVLIVTQELGFKNVSNKNDEALSFYHKELGLDLLINFEEVGNWRYGIMKNVKEDEVGTELLLQTSLFSDVISYVQSKEE
jgi:hypothetical protein|tara:strand:+ start:649 stop:912 length:264 start_codon:yes stop_codon:yes gene_type:complete